MCFACRRVVRRPIDFDGEVPCVECGAPCRGIGYRIPVPPRDNPRAWESLRDSLDEMERERREEAKRARVRRVHELERRIEELARLPDNPGRRRLVRDLGEELDELRGRDG